MWQTLFIIALDRFCLMHSIYRHHILSWTFLHCTSDICAIQIVSIILKCQTENASANVNIIIWFRKWWWWWCIQRKTCESNEMSYENREYIYSASGQQFMNVKALVKWNCSQVCLVHYSGDLVACNPTEKTFWIAFELRWKFASKTIIYFD